MRKLSASPGFDIETQNDELRLMGEAADAAWRAWHYPPGNRTAAARVRAQPHLWAAPEAEREQRAEAAWQEVMQRDLRLAMQRG